MTWRFVPKAWLYRLQLATLAGTALLGMSIAATPRERDVSTLTVIESAMNADVWAYGLVLFSVLGLIAELDMAWRKHERWVTLVAACHIVLCSLLVGYAAAAFWGVLFRIAWNFGAPTLGLLLAYWHLAFTKRRTHA
jgi:hypothetical protein